MDGNAIQSGGLPDMLSDALGRDLPETGRTALRRYGAETHCRAGRVLAWQGDAAERAFFVVAGSVRPLKHRIGAADLTLPQIARGDWACLAEMVSGASVQADYACAADCIVLSFGERNLALLRETTAIEPWLSLCLAREASSLAAFLSEGGPLERIASYLLSRRRTVAGLESSSVSVTQAEIASCLGLTRETVNKRLGELETRGIAETGRGRVSVKDWDALEAIVKGD